MDWLEAAPSESTVPNTGRLPMNLTDICVTNENPTRKHIMNAFNE